MDQRRRLALFDAIRNWMGSPPVFILSLVNTSARLIRMLWAISRMLKGQKHYESIAAKLVIV